MMNLKDRLTEMALHKLEEAGKKYPVSIDLIFEELEELSFWTNLRFGIWSDIKGFTGVDHPADIFTDNL